MLALDSSALVSFFKNEDAEFSRLFKIILISEQIVVSPVVYAEVFSHPLLKTEEIELIEAIKSLPIKEGYWKRAGLVRAFLYKKGCKPKLPDTLIAQSCIDHDVPLLTRDDGFLPFAEFCGLKLYGKV